MREAEQLYTAGEAAARLGASRTWFFERLRAREIPPADVVLPGRGALRAKRWSAGLLQRWIDSRRVDRRAPSV